MTPRLEDKIERGHYLLDVFLVEWNGDAVSNNVDLFLYRIIRVSFLK